MAEVTLFLGASLRKLRPEFASGETAVDLGDATNVAELLTRSGIPVDRARVLLLNHKKAYLDSPIKTGDRLAVFPPELAFNMYVALELAHSGQSGREEPTSDKRESNEDPD